MGIPVWVSRDLVVEKLPEVEEVASGDGHVDGILHDLEIQQTPADIQRVSAPEKATSIAPVAPTLATPELNKQPLELQTNEIGRTTLHTLYACGSLQADWLVIGESPEINSDRQNQPFAGEAGILLSNMLRAVGIDNPRDNAYLINILKDSVQSNTELMQQSNNELHQLLLQKIQQIKPKMLLVVGQLAAQNLLKSKEPLARLRAKEHRLVDTGIPLVVTYYPSYLLSKPLDKRKAWEDLKLAMQLLSD